jgi:hypothetical protein
VRSLGIVRLYLSAGVRPTLFAALQSAGLLVAVLWAKPGLGDLRDKRDVFESGQAGNQIVELKNKPHVLAPETSQLCVARGSENVIASAARRLFC